LFTETVLFLLTFLLILTSVTDVVRETFREFLRDSNTLSMIPIGALVTAHIEFGTVIGCMANAEQLFTILLLTLLSG